MCVLRKLPENTNDSRAAAAFAVWRRRLQIGYFLSGWVGKKLRTALVKAGQHISLQLILKLTFKEGKIAALLVHGSLNSRFPWREALRSGPSTHK